jgi:hypothetical protein
MVPLGDRIDGWWDRPTAGFRRRALVGTSRKDSTKDEVKASTLGYVQALRKAGGEPHQGSAMSAWGAPRPAPSPQGWKCLLTKPTPLLLKPGGVLLFVIPGDRLAECSQILSTHFRDVRVYPLESPECVRYKQVVVLGARRSRRERERLTDSDTTRARLYYASLARNPSQIPALPSEPEARCNVPVA